MLKSFSWEIIRDMTSFLRGRKILNTKEKLINKDFLKHKQANINVKSRRFGVIVTPFSRQSEMNRSFSLSRNKKINRKPFCALTQTADTRRNVSQKFTELSMETPCWCTSMVHIYGAPTWRPVARSIHQGLGLRFPCNDLSLG